MHVCVCVVCHSACLKKSEGISTLLPSCGSHGSSVGVHSLFSVTLWSIGLFLEDSGIWKPWGGVEHFLVLALEADIVVGRKRIANAGTGIHRLHPVSCSRAYQPHCSHAVTPERTVYPSHTASLCCVCRSFGEDSGLDWTVGPRHMVNTKYERSIFGHEQALNMNRGLEQLWLWKSSPQIRSHIRENQNRINLAAFFSAETWEAFVKPFFLSFFLFLYSSQFLAWPNVISALFYTTFSHTPRKGFQKLTPSMDSVAAHSQMEFSS